jgi:hypothetical protein
MNKILKRAKPAVPPVKRGRKRLSVLERATRTSDLRRATRLIETALELDPKRPPPHWNFISERHWRERTPRERAQELEGWLKHECRRLMHLVAGPLPMETVGTND